MMDNEDYGSVFIAAIIVVGLLIVSDIWSTHENSKVNMQEDIDGLHQDVGELRQEVSDLSDSIDDLISALER